MTLARLANPYSVNKKYERQFTDGLREFFEARGEVRGKRVVRQGDVIAVPVSSVAEDDDEGSLLRGKQR